MTRELIERLKGENTRLEARVEELEKEREWQPYRGHPEAERVRLLVEVLGRKDDGEISLSGEPFEVIAKIIHGKIIYELPDYFVNRYILEPTHWQPLQPPPKEDRMMTDRVLEIKLDMYKTLWEHLDIKCQEQQARIKELEEILGWKEQQHYKPDYKVVDILRELTEENYRLEGLLGEED